MKHGIYPIVHTPLKKDESVDYHGLEACINYYNSNSNPGVTVLGSGGELPYFTDKEQLQILKFAREHLNSDKTIIAGLHVHSSKQAHQKIALYSPYIDYVLLLLDDYYDSRFTDYMKAIQNIATHSTKPILFYYFPQITGRFFTHDELTQILNLNNVIGIKDSSLHLATAKRLLNRVPQTVYFSGLSIMLEPIVRQGAAGAICPIATLLPKHTSDYFTAIQKQDKNIKKHRIGLIQILPIVNSLKLPGNIQYFALKVLSSSPIPLIKRVASSHAKIKRALQALGLPIATQSRSPLPKLSDSDEKKVERIMRFLN